MAEPPRYDFDPVQAETFLRAVFGQKPEDHALLLWERGADLKRSHWCHTIDDLLCVAEIASRHRIDLYIGCGTSLADRGAFRRCPANEIAGIPGLWADVDIADDAHPGAARRAPNFHAALAWARALDPRPNVLVHSGHGLHLWWTAPFWAFTNVADRQLAAATLAQFQAWLQQEARPWQLDATQDLSRVLRLPGTVNWKIPEAPCRVEIVEIL